MATKKPAPKKGSGTKYALYGLGAVAVAYVGYKLYQHYEAGAASGTTDSGTTPADTSPTASPSTPTTPTAPPTTLAAWKTAILNYMVNTANIKGGENVAATGLAAALSGHCVGPNEYAALNAALGAVGQPPGSGTLVIHQCRPAPTTTTTAPGSGTSPPNTKPPAPVTSPTSVKVANQRTANQTRIANVKAANARRIANVKAANARRAANRKRAKAPKLGGANPPRPIPKLLPRPKPKPVTSGS